MNYAPKHATVEVDLEELAGIVNELNTIVDIATEVAEWEGGETESATAVRRARDILKGWL